MVKTLMPLLFSSPHSAQTTLGMINISTTSRHRVKPFCTMGSIGYNISELALNRLTEAIAEVYI
jgi:hypothetical protein